ncbi:MAG TPA: rhomboid family intramembrane serine protease [Polyangiaceae bacterium]|nr:rhomboid family intramembrane serine protease [Polyangiaceae bacterium]
MLPIGDQNPTRTRPYVNYLLILANVIAFVWQYLLTSTGGEAWIVAGYGLVPVRFANDPLGEAFTLFTSMFMHGGIGHLVFNLLYLHIFGDNVEDAMGHIKYLVFYLACGVAAGLVQVGVDPGSTVPMVGASGAIAGALGGYIVLYPRAPITVLNPIPFLWLFFGLFLVLPAWLVIGLWFGGNLMSGLAELGEMESGGVAFFAHIGGFVAGMLTVRGFVLGRQRADRYSNFTPAPPRVYYRR